MIKLVIFDLDGVLVDARELHYEALNRALDKYGCSITRDEHLSTYDGLPTTKKLKMLTKNKGLPSDSYEEIWIDKQVQTRNIIDKEFTYNDRIRGVLSALKEDGFSICVCSNSIRETIKMMLLRCGYLEFCDFFISNQDVKNPKPNPEMFLKAMVKKGVGPNECVIVEDSHYGRQAVFNSGAHLCAVENSDQVTYDHIKNVITQASKSSNVESSPKWQGKDLQILIPMAGEGKAYKDAGYKFPKYLVDVAGKPMIQWVIENINADANFIFIVNHEEYEKYNLKHMLSLLVDDPKIITLKEKTEGAPQTVLLAEKFINNNKPLAIINSDQFLEWNSNEFFYAMAADSCDGGIVTFDSTHPMYSFVKIDEETGYVLECAEKKPISRNATAGVYYFKKGKDFVKGSNEMISKGIKTNGQFYICPVYNELINHNMKIRKYDIDNFWTFSLPEDLEYFLKSRKN